MTTRKPMMTRRQLMLGLPAGALLALCNPAAKAHNDAGRVLPPIAPPPLSLTLHDGTRTTLAKVLQGHSTALQLMFTGCSATCPIQGAIFSAVQKNLPASAQVRLVSVSIDPLNDDPAAMRRWLKHFDANPRWLGATPDYRELDRLLDFLRARSKGTDRHTPQVYFFNANGALALRSTDFPSSDEITRLLRQQAPSA